MLFSRWSLMEPQKVYSYKARLTVSNYSMSHAEMAENFKHQGNACFKEGPRKYQNAIKFYTQGIECKVDNELLLNSALHSNRAAVHLELCTSGTVTKEPLTN